MLSKIAKLPILKRLIPSLAIRILKLIGKNRGYYSIRGINMYLDFLDPIDREIILFNEFENLEIEFLISEIKRKKLNYFLDVGANCGYYSLKIAQKISNINIFSFEPNPEAYHKFSKSLLKNFEFLDNIKLENFGLSNENKKLKMQSMIKFGYAQTGGSAVNDKKISEKHYEFFANFKIGDEYLNLSNKNLAIKIDVEGHELNVLHGLKKTLDSNKCILQIEIFNNNFKEVDNFLSYLGYNIFYVIKKRSNYFYSNFKIN